MRVSTILLCCFINVVTGRDFYVGMFKRNDFLVAQDRLYKEGVPFRKVYAKYGRIFKCPISYFRVVDRLGIGRGPKIEIIRGGLRHKYLVLRLQSIYGNPISVNVYVGCENKMQLKTIKKTSVVATTIKAITTDATTDLVEKLGPGSDASDTNSTAVPTTIE